MPEEAGQTWQPREEDRPATWDDAEAAQAQAAIERARVQADTLAGGQQDEQVASGAHGEHLEREAAVPNAPLAGARHQAPAGNPITDTGEMFVPSAPVASEPEPSGEACPSCGRPLPGDHELLAEIKEWLAPHAAEATHRFYERLFEVAPELRDLFPEDIKIQEEKLLSAIIALLDLFQAGDAEMEALNSALARFGRSHTRFDPAATIEEYAAVKAVLFGVVSDMLNEKLTARHVAALTRAYEYAAGMMLAAQATARLSGVGRRRRTV